MRAVLAQVEVLEEQGTVRRVRVYRQTYHGLTYFAERKDKDPNKQHQIWQPIQAKNVYSMAFLQEKLAYIHNNPIAKHWHLAHERADYAYSSTCFYDRDVVPIVQVDDIRERWA